MNEQEWPDEERINNITRNGNNGEHYTQELYNKIIELGVYEV